MATDYRNNPFTLTYDHAIKGQASTPETLAAVAAQPSLGPCPCCGGAVKLIGKNYACEKTLASDTAPATCHFKSGQTILQQAISPEQMGKLLHTGKTDLLDKFISNRTRRPAKIGRASCRERV